MYSNLNKGSFVDVSDDRYSVPDYPMKRNRSASSFESEGPKLRFVVLGFADHGACRNRANVSILQAIGSENWNITA